MTIIQPNKEKKFSLLLVAVLFLPLLAAGTGLVVLYNQTVNLEHNIEAARAEWQKIEAGNAELKDDIFTLFDSASLEFLAVGQGLVKEKYPEYINSERWAFASQY